jgi:hypothetical protein
VAAFVTRWRSLLPLDRLQSADGRDDLAGAGLVAVAVLRTRNRLGLMRRIR